METFNAISMQESLLQYLTPNVMWLVFLVVAGLTILISLVIMWHWDKYAVGLLRRVGTESTFVVITGSLVFLVLVSVIIYVAAY